MPKITLEVSDGAAARIKTALEYNKNTTLSTAEAVDCAKEEIIVFLRRYVIDAEHKIAAEATQQATTMPDIS